MSKNDYYDNTFYLKLNLDAEEKVSVQCVGLKWNENNKRGELTPLSEPISSKNKIDELKDKDIFSSNRPRSESLEGVDPDHLKTYGSLLAKVLLPDKKTVNSNLPTIRRLFLDNWNKVHNGIRVCLLYPTVEGTRDALLSIPWEYVYLPNDKKKAKHDLNYLLGCRSDISIVHCLNPDQQPNPNPIHSCQVKKLKVQMQYLSWFGSDPSNQSIAQSLFEDFNGWQTELDPIITSELMSRTQRAEQTDLINAFITQNLVQVSCHGNPDSILLDKDDDVFTDEIALHTQAIKNENQIKVVILLSCSSGAGDSVARELHFSGVPVVVGITGAINFGPAGRFISGFYQALATKPSHGLEQAVVKGRLNVLNRKNGGWSPEFGYIRVFLNTPHSTLIPERLLYEPEFNMAASFKSSIEEEKERDDENTQAYQEKMKQWVEQQPGSPEGQWLLVTGPAGEGKSTQIKLLLKDIISNQESCPKTDCKSNDASPSEKEPDPCPQKIIYHFCQENSSKTGQSLNFVLDSLVPQLLELYEDIGYKEHINGRFPRLTHNADQALWDFVITPLEKLIDRKKIKEPIIVIDNFDFVPVFQDPTNSILGLLFRYKAPLEGIARFLVTADYVEPKPHDIDGQQAKRPTEASTTIYELTHHEPYDNDIIKIFTPDQPSILFRVMVDRLKKNHLCLSSIPDGKEWRDFYILLDRSVEKAIDITAKNSLHSKDWWQKYLLRFLNVMAVTFEPLFASDIAAIAGISPDGPEKKYLLSILSPFFKDDIQIDNAPLPLFHKRIKNHLRYRMRFKHDKESLADTHELLVAAFRPTSGRWADLNWNDLSGSVWSRQSDTQTKVILPYLNNYLVYHAYYSCYETSWGKLCTRRKRANAFLDLICDPGFRKMRMEEVGWRMALQDIWLGLRVIIAEYTHYAVHANGNHNHTKARVAFDRLLAANQPNSYRQNELIKIEKELRSASEPNGRQLLFKFLNFKTVDQQAWWKNVC